MDVKMLKKIKKFGLVKSLFSLVLCLPISPIMAQEAGKTFIQTVGQNQSPTLSGTITTIGLGIGLALGATYTHHLSRFGTQGKAALKQELFTEWQKGNLERVKELIHTLYPSSNPSSSIKMLWQLLEKDKQKFLSSCINVAAFYGQTDLIQFLYDRGGDVTMQLYPPEEIQRKLPLCKGTSLHFAALGQSPN
ncbi:unnamed protein product, partial [marine sediment metagenome]